MTDPDALIEAHRQVDQEKARKELEKLKVPGHMIPTSERTAMKVDVILAMLEEMNMKLDALLASKQGEE